MQDIIEGTAYVLGDDVDTDQIIPAEHLVYSLSDPEEKKNYGRYALSGVPAPAAGLPEGNKAFVEEGRFESDHRIIIGGKNFGCGSSREHAPACLKIAGIQAVVAESFARIFYRNSVDGGFFIPFEAVERLIGDIKTGDRLVIDVNKGELKNETSGKTWSLKPLGEVSEIIKAGNIFEYARKAGLIPTN
ncbi:MAG: 3-isopropylmalate dehydratase [Candidatus Nitrohelix vancouverensis]|uniref:3-isopropylmalate dehydratase n=1 Tax=Candidatus Nitrohelix vancouverensis TaxID=2705534 RepID=A0A7T0C0S7_9BACT|nr:MAG: 3-isopropylmalate dehydratase [Candidatus Nitrohelix vancouverensis]